MTTDTAEPDTMAEPDPVEHITEKQMQKLIVLCSQAGMRNREEALSWINGVLGTSYDSRKELSKVEASEVIDRLEDGQTRLKEMPPSAGEGPTVQEAIRRVTYDIARIGVGKHGINRDQNYQFRGIDDIVNAMSPLLAKHGVVIIPWVEKTDIDYRPTKSGGTMMYAMLTVDYEIIGPLGDSFRSRIVGLGSDTSDKATNKAMSAAFKYLLGQVFAIPQAGFNDGDADSPGMIAPRSQFDGNPYSNGHDNSAGATDFDKPAEARATAPVNLNQDLLDKIKTYAQEAGVEVATFTTKFRAAHNNATLEQMAWAPRAILQGFVTQVERYRAQEAEEEQQRDPYESAPQP